MCTPPLSKFAKTPAKKQKKIGCVQGVFCKGKKKNPKTIPYVSILTFWDISAFFFLFYPSIIKAILIKKHTPYLTKLTQKQKNLTQKQKNLIQKQKSIQWPKENPYKTYSKKKQN
jgi:hypothetical protein